MKRFTFVLVVVDCIIFSSGFSLTSNSNETNKEFGVNVYKERFVNKQLKMLTNEINDKQEKEVTKEIKELSKVYREIWCDDKVTVSEYELLRRKKAEFHNKILGNTGALINLDDFGEENEKVLMQQLKDELRRKKCSLEESNELIFLYKKMRVFWSEVWSDGFMYKDEYKKFNDIKKEFYKKIEKIFSRK